METNKTLFTLPKIKFPDWAWIIIILSIPLTYLSVFHYSRINMIDFNILYKAGRAVIGVKNPYLSHGYFNPPWFLLLLTPISLIPFDLSRLIWVILGVVGFLVAFKRLGISYPAQLLLFLSPFMYFDLGLGNYEWIVILGVSLSPGIGSWFVMVKPQMGLLQIGIWVKQHNWSALVPGIVLFALLLVGWYSFPATKDLPWSQDVWPWGIPVGLWLGWKAIREEDSLYALAAMPFLSPYVAVQSWIMVLLPLTRKNWYWLALCSLGSWFLLEVIL